MKGTILPLLVLLSAGAFAQRLVGVAGSSATSGGISISWSMGEAMIGTVSGNQAIVTIGFQQAFTEVVSGIEDAPSNGIHVYPNPARDFIVLELQRDYGKDFEVKVFNLSGSTVLQETITAFTGKLELDISTLSSGPYEIILVWPNAKLANIGFIKL
jgi:hypothetical protein